jgi:rod shape determining protein RodA
VFVFFLPIRRFIRLIMPLYWLGIILLIAVLLFGTTKLGATRWLEIPFVNLTIQPSELFKPIFILALAYLISQKPPPHGGYKFKDFGYFSFFIILPFLLIAKEPDLGTALVLLLMGYGILFIVGLNLRVIAGVVLVIAIASPFIYTYMIKDYQKKRINDFLSKEPSYHVQQSIIAIGSGGLTGKDVEEATQAQLKFLPIATSDFIFAYLVERYGFIGGVGVVILYLLLIVYLLMLNFYYQKDYLISVFASGIGLLIFLDMAVNILMVIGFAPVVGLPLPMFSYGGSSFINFIVIFAILENLLAFRFLAGYDLTKKF